MSGQQVRHQKTEGYSLRPPQVVTPRGADDLPVLTDRNASQESGLDPTREFQPLEGGIALFGFGLGGVHREAFMRVDEDDVGIVARSNIALAEQTKSLRWLPT